MKFFGRLAILAQWAWLCAAAAACYGATNDAVISIGDVKVDSRSRTLSFPAEVNQRSGAVEYLVVHETGKVHESLFRTKVPPQQIHVVALLLSEKATNAVGGNVVFPAPTIRVSWKEAGKEKNVAAEELILDKKKKRALGKTKWAYRGSRTVEGAFLAQRDGSIVAVMEDRDALIDQDTPDAADDENWEPATEAMPALKEHVMVHITFARAKGE